MVRCRRVTAALQAAAKKSGPGVGIGMRSIDTPIRSVTLAPPLTGNTSLNLGSIQGNILPGFNKDHQAFLFVRFRGADEGLRWLRAILPELASAAEVEGFRTAFRSMKQ